MAKPLSELEKKMSPEALAEAKRIGEELLVIYDLWYQQVVRLLSVLYLVRNKKK